MHVFTVPYTCICMDAYNAVYVNLDHQAGGERMGPGDWGGHRWGGGDGLQWLGGVRGTASGGGIRGG